MTDLLQRVARSVLPPSVRGWLAHRLGWNNDLGNVFSRIYRDGAWGGAKGRFYSGAGSHDPQVVTPYVQAVRSFLQGLARPVHLVDIGCGDFNVGRQLIDSVDRYLGCDVVPELIARNRREFSAPGLGFQVVDAVRDALPDGNVVCVRQVLQHLSNEHVAAIVAKLGLFRYWIITEHLPPEDGFTPNVDKSAGGTIRLDGTRSGIVLTAPPFRVRPQHEQVICEVPAYGGVIRTTVFTFA